MPVYNGEGRIEKALNSLLSQSFKNFELIISDDNSSDNTANICDEYAAKDARIKFYRQKNNSGLVKNFAFVLNQAKGDYFMWAAQDDWWDENFIRKMVEAMEKNPEYVVAMSHYKIISDSGKITETSLGRHDFTKLSNYRLFRVILSAKDNPIFEYGLFRTDFLKKLFSRLKPHSIEDTVILMSEAALAGKFYSVPEFLHIKYRNPKNLRERHYLGNYYGEPCPYTKFIKTLLVWLITSRVIPFRRKFLIFWPWLRKLIHYRRKIFRELFGRFQS